MRSSLWLLAAVSVATLAVLANRADASRHAELRLAGINGGAYADFPLWKDVRGGHFAQLGGGHLGTTRWAAYVSRVSASPGARQRPCLTLAKISGGGVFGNASGCGPLAPSGHPRRIPIYLLIGGIAGSTDTAAPTEEAFFSMSVSRNIRQLMLAFEANGEQLDVERVPELLSMRKARKAGVAPFRFAAFAMHRDVCLRHVSGYDSEGAKVLDAEVAECG